MRNAREQIEALYQSLMKIAHARLWLMRERCYEAADVVHQAYPGIVRFIERHPDACREEILCVSKTIIHRTHRDMMRKHAGTRHGQCRSLPRCLDDSADRPCDHEGFQRVEDADFLGALRSRLDDKQCAMMDFFQHCNSPTGEQMQRYLGVGHWTSVTRRWNPIRRMADALAV